MKKLIKAKHWYCSVCGSTDVEFKVWIKANGGKESDTNGIDRDEQWCCNCEEHNKLEYAIDDIELKFNETR